MQKRKEYIHQSGLLLAGVDVSKAKGALSIFDLLQQGALPGAHVSLA